MKINKIVIDSSDSITDLCMLGKLYGTDKSPYNTNSTLHKHPYTAVYDFIFGPLRYMYLEIAEIGILDNKSMMCWREYFPHAKLYGFEYDHNRLTKAVIDNLQNTEYHYMNVKAEESIQVSLEGAGCKFDIIVEDSTHEFADQIRFAKIATKFLKPGGILVIEDIFRNASEQQYAEQLNELSAYYSSATFVMTEHIFKHSPGWDNDKLLILYRNEVD
jgi:SAM-dependent methyltransferase